MLSSNRWRDLGAAASLATLWFIVPLKELLYPGTDYYLIAEPHSAFEYLAVFSDVILLTIVFYGILFLIARSEGTRLGLVFTLLFVFLGVIAFGPLNYELMKWIAPDARSSLVSLPLSVIVLALCVVLAYRNGLRLANIAGNLQILALLLLPFTFVIVFQALRDEVDFSHASLSPAYIESQAAPSERKTKRRVVWIVFDELDYRAESTASKNGIYLDEIDRIKNEALVSHGALSPNMNTMESIPALLTGRPVKRSRAESSRDLLLYSGNADQPVSFRQSENAFTDVRSLGGISAAVGWYHPYSRLFENEVSYCYWSPQSTPDCSSASSFVSCGARFFIHSLERLPLSQRLLPESFWVAEDLLRYEDPVTQRNRHQFLLGKAEQLIGRSDLSFLFLHFSIPHYPTIALEPLDGKENYFTSLEVVNDTVGRLRREMERTGEWNDTVLIITSDHPWRVKTSADFQYLPLEERGDAAKDNRIPFIVRFPGQSTPVDLNLRFNTVVTRSVVREILAENILTANDLEQWLVDNAIQ